MKYGVYAVFDSKAEAYLAPFFHATDGTAKREFGKVVQQKGHNFCEFPEDFTLMKLGVWDDESAKFEELLTPFSLGVGLEYKKAGEPLGSEPYGFLKEMNDAG